MIVIYSGRHFNELVKSKTQSKLACTMERIDAKAMRNVENRKKNILKAKRQKRLKNGQFAKPASVENNLMVQFFYPMSNEPLTSKLRQVRLISLTATHFTGMERVGDKWKFKKYLAPKARGFRIVSFNPQSMS